MVALADSEERPSRRMLAEEATPTPRDLTMSMTEINIFVYSSSRKLMQNDHLRELLVTPKCFPIKFNAIRAFKFA